MEEIRKIMNKLSILLASEEFINTHKQRSQDFTRNVKLSFGEIVKFVLSKTGNTLDLEAYSFCKNQDKKVSTSAICQARSKVKYTAFEALLKETSKDIAIKNLYKGYRLTSYDGMQGELPCTPELMEKYRPQASSGYPMFHALAQYDVLNCCYTNAIFAPAPADERALACQLISSHDYNGDEIFLLDRGFPSIKVIQILEASGKKYVMRVSGSFLREINEFTKTAAADKIIKVHFDKRRKVLNRVSFDGEEYEFTIRCVKVQLSKGENEFLITNLTKQEMTKSEIADIYNLRWRIETAFLDLKYAVHIEDFMSKKEDFIKQEFYTSLIQANISMLFMDIANSVIQKSKKKKNWTTP